MSRRERGLQSAFCIVNGLKSIFHRLNIEKQQPISFAYNTGRSNLVAGKTCHLSL